MAVKKSRSYVALLRGINVGTSTRIPMDRLRELCEELRWRDVRTYIQSGNIVFTATGEPRRLEEQLEKAIPPVFGVSPAVIVRDSDEWARLADGNPFEAVARESSKLVMLALSKRPLLPTALETLRERAGSERLERVGDAIWIYFADGSGRSKITPTVLDRAAGSPVTMRNLNTVLKIAAMNDAA